LSPSASVAVAMVDGSQIILVRRSIVLSNNNNNIVMHWPSTKFSIVAIFFSTMSYTVLPISDILEDVTGAQLLQYQPRKGYTEMHQIRRHNAATI
jgi:hypothetical protein